METIKFFLCHEMGWTEAEFLGQDVNFIKGLLTFIMEVRNKANGK